MWPTLAHLPFIGLGLVAVALVGALLLRGPLVARWGRRGLWAAVAGGALIGIAAASLGLVAWTGTWIITTYAVFLVVGVLAARWLFLRACRHDAALERAATHANDLTLVALIAGLIGARARYVWENWATFTTADGIDWRRIADLDQGGMVWYGGLIAGALAVVAWAWRLRIPLLPLADATAPALAVGLAFGRLGCFFNGCCYGRVCDLPWAVTFPGHDEARHPTQLYESGVAFGLTILLTILHRRPVRPGIVAALFCIIYGVWRFINETLRDDYRHAGTLNDLGGWQLTNSQITSLWLLVVGCVLITWSRYRPTTPNAPGGS